MSAALGLLGACAPAQQEATRELDRLERLVWVSAGTVPSLDLDVEQDLLVDAYETTRAEWRRHLEAERALESDDWRPKLAQWAAADDRLPASWMTRDEAERYAARQGLRLPSVAEWLLVAAGPQGRLFPWGDTRFDSVADTLELGLARAAPVGTFESGRTPDGVYDVLGNVWEWCSDASPTRETDGGDACAFGASYLSYARPIFSYNDRKLCVLALDSQSRADDVGLRLVANARDYLWSVAPRLAVTADSRERLLRVGRRFGARASAVLDELSRRDGAPPALALLFEGAHR